MENIKSFILTKKVAIISLTISLVLSLFVLYTPKIVSSDDLSKFSSVRASAHIAEISKKPHSYYDQVELEEVRVYIENTLEDYLGITNVRRDSYDVHSMKTILNEDLKYPVVNIMGKLQGKSDLGILLVSHYDSRGHIGRFGELGQSYGAMDDGYGVSTMLELAFIFKELNPENSIYFLFTDAEEVGLYGAKLAAQDNNVMDNVRFVMNLESRGQFGPSYMFETSNNNKKVIELYKHAKFPVTYSMATAVYSVMPNFTDFTPFMDKNVPGMNFANLAGLDYYHSPLDSYEKISMTTIQHMGSQVEPILREFISDSKYVENNYFDATSDQVFFTLFPNVFVSYTNTAAIVILALVVIAFALTTFLKVKDQTLEKDVLKKSLPKSLLLTIVILITSYLFSNIVAFLGKVPFSLFYVRVTGIEIFVLIFMLLVVLTLVKYIRKTKVNNILYIGLAFNLVLSILTTFLLPGASFLFTISTIVGMIVLVSDYFNNNYLKHSLLIFSYLISLLIIVPLLYSFYMALTVGGLVILVLLLILNASIFLPAIIKQFEIGEDLSASK